MNQSDTQLSRVLKYNAYGGADSTAVYRTHYFCGGCRRDIGGVYGGACYGHPKTPEDLEARNQTPHGLGEWSSDTSPLEYYAFCPWCGVRFENEWWRDRNIENDRRSPEEIAGKVSSDGLGYTKEDQLERHRRAQREGTAWVIYESYGEEKCRTASRPDPDDPGCSVISFGEVEPDEWIVASSFVGNLEKGRFKSRATAERKRDELNRFDVQGPLDSQFSERRKRFREYCAAHTETFWVNYGSGPVEARWPVRPDRYAYTVWSDRYSGSFAETAKTLDEVKQAILDEGACDVVDLETGEKLDFKATVTWG